MLTLRFDENVSQKVQSLLQRGGNLSIPMEKIKQSVFSTEVTRGWWRSGLHVRSGELLRAITPFSGKVSSGIGLRSKKGRDLVWPKAVTHTFGLKKSRASQGKYRRNKRTGKMFKRAPWGDIPARPFMPTAIDVNRYIPGCITIIEEYLHAETS